MMETVAVMGLGYVGLPLAVAFGRDRPTIGFDVNAEKIASFRKHHDPTGEVSSSELKGATHLRLTADSADLAAADYIIVAVPTPLAEATRPDFGPLLKASELAGRHMRQGAIVVFESTVYPGATEELCVPMLEAGSGLRWKQDFHVGYSPERINPGDKERRLADIVKLVAGDDAGTLDKVARLYESVVAAGVHRTSSIAVAEAAKVIENTQRDLNIALMNELAIIFGRLGLDTEEVLTAAGTKWNFLPFRPGLVGGHCIGIDPYYLTHKAERMGYHPQVVLAGRRINDGMGKYVAEQSVKQMIGNGLRVKGSKVAVLGLTFKEDCPDLRNSRVIDVIEELRSYGTEVHVHDPVADPKEAQREYGLELSVWEALPEVSAIVIAVGHRQYRQTPAEAYLAKLEAPGLLVDVKWVVDPAPFRAAGTTVWRL
jgi:UDP-N-acetyl-D-glucosamine/UDP-N-acetyl-D-galactosamine dehydrogenase